MRSKIAQATNTADPQTINQSEAEKYRLVVTAGPSYDQKEHKIIHVNTETPTYIENDFLRAKIQVRVRGFRGLPSKCPSTTEYFSDPMHKRDQYSLGFSFVPKRDLPSLNTVWGNDLDHPVRDRIPPGFNTAFRIVKEFIDPGLSCDVYADEPWLYGPSLSCWFAFRIGDKVDDGKEFPAPGVLREGADGSGQTLRDEHGLPENNEKRRKHFLDAGHRESFVFEKGRLYQGDFYNPYLDFANYALKLPGFSLNVIKYIGEKTHCLRYVFKNRQTGDVYFNVNFTLLWGEQLRKALEDVDGVREQAGAGAELTTDQNDQPGEAEAKSSKSASVNDEESQKSTAPAGMQLHPGDHAAVAQNMINDQGVDEIDRLLQQTSTKQKRDGGPILPSMDDVD